MQEIRCKNVMDNGYLCNRLLGMVNGKYSIKCPKCGTLRVGDTNEESTNLKGESVNDEKDRE
jgi:phage FluMu protein Com